MALKLGKSDSDGDLSVSETSRVSLTNNLVGLSWKTNSIRFGYKPQTYE